MKRAPALKMISTLALVMWLGMAWADEGRGRGPGNSPGEAPRKGSVGGSAPTRAPVRASPVRPAPFSFDDRHFHNHYYPARGYAVPAVPSGSVRILFGSRPFYYHSGVWWQPVGASFQVVVPPFGIMVPVLPADAVLLMVAGIAFYYANGVYYRHDPGQGYVVVQAPTGVEQVQPQQQSASVPKAPPPPVIYPRNGQSQAQIEADRQDCNRWATTQPAAMADGEVFQRAFAACMDARGYTVR